MMGLPPQFVYDENVKLRAEIERLKEELAISAQAVGVSEWRRQECMRLRAALEVIASGRSMDDVPYVEVARKALTAEQEINFDVIVPSELSGDDLFNHNGKYVPIQAIAATIERCAQVIDEYFGSDENLLSRRIRALKEKP